MHAIQSVLNRLENINPQIKNYVMGLLLTSGRKTCTEISRSTGIAQKKLYDFLSKGRDNAAEIEKELLLIANATRKQDVPRALIVDPTTMATTTCSKHGRSMS
jgi:hypothetical protein